MYEQNLEMLRLARAGTLRLCSGIGQAQSDFVPAVGKWSTGEVVDHLLLAEAFYRGIFVKLIQLQKSGQRPALDIGFSEVNTSIAYIPKAILPMLDIPFTIFNMFVPNGVREVLTQFRLLPAQNPDMTTPQKGKPIHELRKALSASYEETAALFHANPGLNYREMRYRHPLMGDNNVLQSLRILALHERRHQSQIQDIVRSSQSSKVA
jgi:DinB superfamily